MKTLLAHALMTVATGALASVLYFREDQPKEYKEDRVMVWDGSPEAVRSITYDSLAAKASLEPKRDAYGRYFVIHLEKNEIPEGGGPAVHKQLAFIATTSAETFLKKVAPLRAFRALGKLSSEQFDEFLLAKPEGTFSIDIGGKVHRLKVGGRTHSGVERYVENLDTGDAFAIPSELPSYMPYADTRLMEHSYHTFAAIKAERISIQAGARTREVVRMREKQDGWADAKSATTLDETVGNWLSKLDRLQIVAYVEKEPELPPESQLFRVQYARGNEQLGFLELHRTAAGYFVRSEYSRWYTQPVSGLADQLMFDLDSVFPEK